MTTAYQLRKEGFAKEYRQEPWRILILLVRLHIQLFRLEESGPGCLVSLFGADGVEVPTSLILPRRTRFMACQQKPGATAAKRRPQAPFWRCSGYFENVVAAAASRNNANRRGPKQRSKRKIVSHKGRLFDDQSEAMCHSTLQLQMLQFALCLKWAEFQSHSPD